MQAQNAIQCADGKSYQVCGRDAVLEVADLVRDVFGIGQLDVGFRDKVREPVVGRLQFLTLRGIAGLCV